MHTSIHTMQATTPGGYFTTCTCAYARAHTPLHTHTRTHTSTHTHTHSLSLALSLSRTHTHMQTTRDGRPVLTLQQTHTHTLSLSFSLSHTHARNTHIYTRAFSHALRNTHMHTMLTRIITPAYTHAPPLHAGHEGRAPRAYLTQYNAHTHTKPHSQSLSHTHTGHEGRAPGAYVATVSCKWQVCLSVTTLLKMVGLQDSLQHTVTLCKTLQCSSMRWQSSVCDQLICTNERCL